MIKLYILVQGQYSNLFSFMFLLFYLIVPVTKDATECQDIPYQCVSSLQKLQII